MMKNIFTPLLLLGAVAAGPATQPASTKPADDFVVSGTVTDDTGKPMKGAYVYARCGTPDYLVRTGATTSDKMGRYRLVFGPGVGHEQGLGHEVVGFQEALVAVVRGGYFEKNLNRQGDLAMSDDPKHMSDPDYAGVVRIHRPYHLDFVLSKGAIVEGTMVDPAGKPRSGVTVYLTGPDLPPMTTVVTGNKTDDDGKFRFKDVPTDYAWTFMIRDRDYAEDVVAPEPLKLTTAETVSVKLTSDPEKHTLASAPAVVP